MTRNKIKNKHPSRYFGLNDAKKIVILANMHKKAGKSNYLYKISKEINISIKIIKRTLEKSFSHKIFKPRINQQWKGTKITKVYSVTIWKHEDRKRRKNKNKANFIKKAKKFNLFASFIKEKYNSGVNFITTNGIKKKYPRYYVEAYIDEFKKAYPNSFCPSKSAV